MNDGLVRADQGLDCSLDQVLARLHQYLEPHIVGRAFFLDKPAIEGELCIGRGGKADFNLLEPAFYQRLKKFEFLAHVHGHRERLVAVAQVHTAPDRRAGEHPVRPLPVRQSDRRERTILDGGVF